MKTLNFCQPRWRDVLVWLLSLLLLAAAGTGCSKKDAAIDSLQKRNIPVTADSLGLYSSKGDLVTVKLLLDAGIDVNAADSRGSYALIDAAWAGKMESVTFLLDTKADINRASTGKLTALGAASSQNHGPVALLLLERGADPNAFDATGSTPLMHAAWKGNLPLVKALLAKGAGTNHKRADNGLTALKAATDKAEIVQALKAAGATE